MVLVRHSTTSSAGRPDVAQQLEHVVGDVDVELGGELHHAAGRAPADDDVPHAGDHGELLADRVGELGWCVGAELEHRRTLFARPRRGAGFSGRGRTAGRSRGRR